jgi:hypothetical protein
MDQRSRSLNDPPRSCVPCSLIIILTRLMLRSGKNTRHIALLFHNSAALAALEPCETGKMTRNEPGKLHRPGTLGRG